MSFTAPFKNSIFKRFALRSAVIALGSILLLYGVTAALVMNSSTHSLRSAVDTDIAGLVDIYASGGESELIRRIDDRQTLVSTEARRAHYAITDASMMTKAGDVRVWPNLDPALSEFGYVTLSDGKNVYARVTSLSPELNLLVAREYDSDTAFMKQLTLAFLVIGIFIMGLVTALGRKAAASLARRVERINLTLEGANEQPLILSEADIGANDEIGILAKNSANSIARISALARAQRHMTDHVAHELRTPLMHLDNRLLSALNSETDNKNAIALQNGRQDIKRIGLLLDSLLDIAANEARKGDLSGLKQIDLSRLLLSVLDLYEGSLEEAGMTLQKDIAPAVVIAGEDMQITRMISNLLDNAIKYAGKGTCLTVCLQPGPQLIISDNGQGISEERRATIFDRFQRGRSVQHIGHGLGLALVRAICERHGLEIKLLDNKSGCSFLIKPERYNDD